MDLVHDRASIIADEDRISNLPDEIIHHILSFFDMRYAVQTSTLSKKWKHIWTSMPHLNFKSETCRTLPQYAEFVKHALSHHNHRTKVFAVDLTFRGDFRQFFVRSILNYAYSHNVRQLTLVGLTDKLSGIPQCLFSSHTLKHLTITFSTSQRSLYYWLDSGFFPESAWDFPALESLNLSNVRLGSGMAKSLNLFSKCVNLKDLTIHRFSLYGLDVFTICAPQLSNLTITNSYAFPKLLNVVAPQLVNLTASVSITGESETLYMCRDTKGFDSLWLSTEGLDSLEKVKLSLPTACYKWKRYVPLHDLFQKLRSAKFLIIDVNIIELCAKALSLCPDPLSRERCPFDNLKCLEIDTEEKELIATIPTQVRNYFLECSPSATLVDLPQVPQKRSRQQVDKDTIAKKIAKLEEEKQQAMVEEKKMLEAKIHMFDEVIAQQKAMQKPVKLQHEKLMSQIIKCKMAKLQVQVEGGNPDYEIIHSMGCDIKSIMDSTPESLRVAVEAQFHWRYEEVKSLFFTHVDASQWAKIETELGYTRPSERTHSVNFNS